MVRSARTTKSADDWVSAGLAELARSGPAAIKVELLAKALGVTKGSFYWHFRDRKALLGALLARWEALSTQAVIDRVNAGGGTPAQRVAALVETTSQSKRAAHVEQAIRAWGARDKRARSVLAAVDTQREAYVRGLLIEHGLSAKLAGERARLIYLALIGEFAWVSHGGAPSGAGPFRELVRSMLR